MHAAVALLTCFWVVALIAVLLEETMVEVMLLWAVVEDAGGGFWDLQGLSGLILIHASIMC
jgi:hypothetical protein